MPSTITHAYFGMDLYERLDKNKQTLLEDYKNQLKVFAQGPDVFFFYHLLCPKSGGKIRTLGHTVQRNKTQNFFVNLIKLIKDKHWEKEPEIIAFLYGFIAHYTLDMTVHPLVVYKTGIYNKKDPKTKKYFGGHECMETYIDAYMIQTRSKMKPYKFDAQRFCFSKTHISEDLKSLIDDLFVGTFNVENIGEKYASSVQQMKTFYFLFRNDYTGIKKQIYKICSIFPFAIKLEAISYHVKLDRNEYYLNYDKQPWHHPLDKNEVYNYSFIELYTIALFKAYKIVKEVDKVLLGKKNIEYLRQIFPNLSYVTGKDCKLGPGKYFGF